MPRDKQISSKKVAIIVVAIFLLCSYLVRLHLINETRKGAMEAYKIAKPMLHKTWYDEKYRRALIATKKNYWKVYIYPDLEYSMRHPCFDGDGPIVYVDKKTKKVIRIENSPIGMNQVNEFICPFPEHTQFYGTKFKTIVYGSRWTVLYDNNGIRRKCIDIMYWSEKSYKFWKRKSKTRSKN